MQTHKAPVLAKDAVYKLVDYGLPLERFKNDNTCKNRFPLFFPVRIVNFFCQIDLQFYKEREFLGRTSEFKPTKTPYIRDHAVKRKKKFKLSRLILTLSIRTDT